jgi:hypothetical protein
LVIYPMGGAISSHENDCNPYQLRQIRCQIRSPVLPGKRLEQDSLLHWLPRKAP